ncbi:nucleotidyltransferase family protein [Candidatus Woesearchaeota archaeon]|nr:nucleotidyltransferase family protein [Candidatus Woesearchaeota archaeon]
MEEKLIKKLIKKSSIPKNSENFWARKSYDFLGKKEFEIIGEKQKPLRKALVMAGGFGTRMKDLTKDMPKPMLKLQEKPILDYSIELCKRYGINDISLSIFYMGEKIRKHYGNGSKHGISIRYVEEKEPLGTAGAMRLHKRWLSEPFLMCNADELKDINLQLMYEQHVKTGAAATIALTEVEDPSQYGVVALDGKRIAFFVEKPKKEEAPSNLINAGLYIINPDVIKLVPPGYCMIERHIFPLLAEHGMLYGFPFKGQWFDTGTPERYAHAGSSWQGFKEPVRGKPVLRKFKLLENATP